MTKAKETSYKNPLFDALRLNDAVKGNKTKGYYEDDINIISFKTWFPSLEYRLGHRVYAKVKYDEVESTYLNFGIASGLYVFLFIGKPCGSKKQW